MLPFGACTELNNHRKTEEEEEEECPLGLEDEEKQQSPARHEFENGVDAEKVKMTKDGMTKKMNDGNVRSSNQRVVR